VVHGVTEHGDDFSLSVEDTTRKGPDQPTS
jgi:hypothetical protein